MAIPPNIKARLEQLKAQAAMKAEMERRQALAQQNAEKMAGQPMRLPIDKKAEGGQPSQDAMRLMLNKHGMYSPLEKSLMSVPRSKGTPAEFMAEASKQPGYRAEEVADRKISLPEKKMTKAEMLAHLQKHPMPEIQQKVAGGVDQNELEQRAYEIAYEQAKQGVLKLDPKAMETSYGKRLIQDTAFSQYEAFEDEFLRKAADEIGQPEAFHEDFILPGGENYREVMLKKPEFTGDKQIRDLELELNRVSPEQRVEIMRKITALKDAKERHGEMFTGNPSHFGGEPGILASLRLTDRKGPNGEKILHVEEIQSDWHQAGRKNGYKSDETEARRKKLRDLSWPYMERNQPIPQELRAQIDELPPIIGGVPDAPFKKSWHEMALKHVLGMAVKDGYHGIAITPGEQQADRYDLSKHINKIDVGMDESGEYSVIAEDKNGREVMNQLVPAEKLADHVGKEMADKIVNKIKSPDEVPTTFSGLDLRVGGEGMKGFYDKIVPTFLNKLGKPHGVQVQMHSLPVQTGEKMVPDRAGLGMIRSGEPEVTNLHYLPINDAMRNKIKTEGLPQYRSGGAVQGFDNGGAAFGVFPQMRGRRSQQNIEASKDVPVAAARGVVSGLGGTLGDIEKLGRNVLNFSFGPGGVRVPTETVLPTSEDVAKMLPFESASQTPVGQAATTLGQLVGGGLSGPAVSKSSGPLMDLAWKIKGDVPMGQAGPAVWVGKNSPAFDRFAMLKAERMERSGATAEEIKAATNMERDIYGSWRQQESLGDLEMRTVPDIREMYGVDPTKDPISLTQAFGNNTLASLYPDVFRDMNMMYSYNRGAGSGIIPPRTLSPTDPGQLKINLSQGYKPLEDIAHEAQHGIQSAEKMPLSESMMFAHKSPSYENILKEVQANPSAYATEGPDYTKAAYEWYTRQPAEVEARAAAAASSMSPEARRTTLMSDLYDVPREKILVDPSDVKPITYSDVLTPNIQSSISGADIAGQIFPETPDTSFFDQFTGGADTSGPDLSSFFNLVGAEGPMDMSSMFGDMSSYSGEDFAEGGAVSPSGPNIAQMRLSLMKMNPANLKNMGVNESIDVDPKLYMPPETQTGAFPPPGGVATPSGMPIGGVDMSQMQPGQQLMPQSNMQPQGGPQQPQEAPQGQPGMQPPQGMPGAPGQPPMGPQSSILQMTPQGQTLAALGGGQTQAPKPPGMAKGGSAKSVEDMKRELAEKGDQPKRIQINAEGSGGVKGIVVPRHMWEGTKHAEGMKHVNEARAKVYGSEHRAPLTLGQIASIHKKTLNEHFSKPVDEQVSAENEALERLRAAKHIGKTANTLDESEKLDTVRHEHDEHGRTYVGYASKGTAGHALYTSGHGKDIKHHVINTCPGQTTGCGGGVDEKGIVDTKRGTCFAPNAESQYVNAAVRRASHEQAKHDPAMTKDWILAHTGSLRSAAEKADKKNQVTLFRPNVVDETDVSSRHVIKHLNKQRKEDGKPGIVANSYGKTNELHDPENGYYVTHSNVGPKVKKGQEISENIARDKQRVRSTIHASTAGGEDLKNDEGNKTPPKNSYMVTDVKRGSPLSKKMEKHITHAKYWSTGREEHELSKAEREEGPEGHFSGAGRPTTPEKAHYGHTTLNGKRYDYQKQHILHPRLVQVGKNDDGTPHMIPTDSRFKDEEFLPKNRFKTKNGKNAGAILMTTPTESTSNLGHQTSFTHHVNDKHIEHAMKNNGEYEIDAPHEQEKAKGKEYAAPQPIKFMAEGGSVGRHPELDHDDYHAFPERNFHAQYHLARRHDPHDSGDDAYVRAAMGKAHRKNKRVALHKNMDTMRLELTKKAK